MSAHARPTNEAPNAIDLETAGFHVQGLGQALHALSTSESVVRELGWALTILAQAADDAAATIAAFVETDAA